MAYEQSIARYRFWYARLLRLHPRDHHARFAESMEQTFADLLRDASKERADLFTCASWMFVETFVAIIKENLSSIGMISSIIRPLIGTAVILLIPLVAMQFTSDVNWTGSDFAVAGIVLFVTGLSLDLVLTKMGKYRLVTAGVIVFLFLWLWAELAVGVFTNWGS